MRISNKSTVYDTFLDVSGTVAVGGTQQALLGKNPDRFYLFFQNISTGDLWLNHTSPAQVNVAGNIRVRPGEVFSMEGSFVTAEPWNVIGSSSGQAFTCKENNPSTGNV